MPEPARVLVLAPGGRDAELAIQALARAGIAAEPCASVVTLCAAIEEGASCALVTETAFDKRSLAALLEVLGRQPPWSDFPFVLFARDGRSRLPPDALRQLGNVTILDRPVKLRSMLSAVDAALRGRARQHQARRAIEQRDQFLAMLGHELRNPLAAIGFAAASLDLIADRNTERQRTVIARQTRHLARLVDDLLDVSRVTTGKIRLAREPVDLCDLAARTIQVLEPMTAASGQRVALELPACPLVIDGDADRLEEILSNLIRNASKFSPCGSTITVTLGRDAATDEAIVAVSDRGVGLAPEYLDTIFDLFAQAPSSLDRSQGGLGLGLTLVRSLVELHGGRVSAASDGPGKGATFAFRVPLSTAPVRVAPTGPTVTADGVTGARIAVVDDNEDLRVMLAEVLEVLGNEVVCAADGHAGVEQILGFRPDIAMIDIGLPGIDGYEVARRVRHALGPSIKLVAMTGYGMDDDRDRAKAAGFDLHLTKPVTASALAELVESSGRAPAAAAESRST
jgi:signal transduction histidine kinase/ActR/RegA family two-component response regulator